MANFQRVTISNTSPSPIIASQWGALVSIEEDVWTTSWPTTNLLVFHVNANGGGPTAIPRNIQQGSSYTFTKGLTNSQTYAPNEVVGYVQSVTGSGVVIIVDEAGS